MVEVKIGIVRVGEDGKSHHICPECMECKTCEDCECEKPKEQTVEEKLGIKIKDTPVESEEQIPEDTVAVDKDDLQNMLTLIRYFTIADTYGDAKLCEWEDQYL